MKCIAWSADHSFFSTKLLVIHPCSVSLWLRKCRNYSVLDSSTFETTGKTVTCSRRKIINTNNLLFFCFSMYEINYKIYCDSVGQR